MARHDALPRITTPLYAFLCIYIYIYILPQQATLRMNLSCSAAAVRRPPASAVDARNANLEVPQRLLGAILEVL